MQSRILNPLFAGALGLLVLVCGAMEGWYQEYFYGADGIAYFDAANCLRHGDWSPALNTYWSIGYPLILAATRWLFPAGPEGEWIAVHATNLAIFMATYASFLWFLNAAIAYLSRDGRGGEGMFGIRALYFVATLIFLVWQLQAKIVSRTTPDLLVSGLFFLLMAASLQFCLRPTVKSALLIGLFAGLGYVAKAVFLPVSLAVLLVVLIRVVLRRGPDRFSAIPALLWAMPPMALLVVPYIIVMSIGTGRITTGESGPLNYAWTVNGLTHWHWTGGPAAFGDPIHPVRLVSTSPHVYEFAEPFHVTYPPFYNPAYWYEGYHHFFRLGNEIAAIKRNQFALTVLFFDTPHAPVKAVAALVLTIVAVFLFADAKKYGQRLLAAWPLYVPSLIGVGLYLVVFLEPRYVMGFLIILTVVPLLVLFLPTPLADRRIGHLVLLLVAVICAVHLYKDERPLFERALRHETLASDEDWRIGLYLAAHGPPPGTKVAMVRVERGLQTTWAYISGLQIVGQIGNQDFTEAQQQQDFDLFVNQPEAQQAVLALFRKSGAACVIALGVSGAPQGEGWSQVPGTQAWIHAL